MNRSLISWILITLVLVLGVVCFYERRLTSLKSENIRLTNRLTFLEPPAPQLIWPEALTTFPHTARKVMEKGSKITCRTLELNDKWNRPLYIPLWHSDAWNSNRFCYVPRLIENNRHRVFIYQGGGSYWFDLSPTMGFTDDTSPMGIAFKTGEEVAIIALEARVKEIIKLENQLQIVIETMRRGYHIVAIPYRDYRGSLCQVVTPEGYEIEVPVTSYSNDSYQ